MKFDNYYLDLKKVSKIDSEEERKQIHRYYMDMMQFSIDNRNSIAISIFNTLNQSGFLKEVRSEKIDKLLS
jgi:beta-galactosidase beta subunit